MFKNRALRRQSHIPCFEIFDLEVCKALETQAFRPSYSLTTTPKIGKLSPHTFDRQRRFEAFWRRDSRFLTPRVVVAPIEETITTQTPLALWWGLGPHACSTTLIFKLAKPGSSDGHACPPSKLKPAASKNEVEDFRRLSTQM